MCGRILDLIFMCLLCLLLYWICILSIRFLVFVSQEKKLLQEERKKLLKENELLMKNKDALEQEILLLKKSLEGSLKDSKEKEKKVT